MKIIPQHLENFKLAMEFYSTLGFKNIEVPWFVSQKADDATRPKNRRSFTTSLGNLVGSAEQSFIEMMLEEELPSGHYQTLTPCFRDDVSGPIHSTTFMKLELIDTTPNACEIQMVERARSCFSALGIWTSVVKNKSDELDLIFQSKSGSIELGSYGKRNYEGLTWVYGTGLAEPRFSIALTG